MSADSRYAGSLQEEFYPLPQGMVDLYGMHIRLKAEFQASNRDMYGDSMTLHRHEVGPCHPTPSP